MILYAILTNLLKYDMITYDMIGRPASSAAPTSRRAAARRPRKILTHNINYHICITHIFANKHILYF